MQHGVLDRRIPISQAFQYYRALQQEEKTVLLQVYPNMGHSPMTPQTRIDIMKASFDWFTKYLVPEES